MKILSILFFIVYSTCCAAQPDIKKIVSENKEIPSGWQGILTSKHSWTLIKEGSWANDSVRSLKNPVLRGVIVRFTNDSLIYQTNNNTGIEYFPLNGTYYTGKNYNEYWDMGSSVVSSIIYIDSGLLILRKVPFFLFEKNSGRIRSYDEYYKLATEKRKTIPPGEFIDGNLYYEPNEVLLEVYKAN